MNWNMIYTVPDAVLLTFPARLQRQHFESPRLPNLTVRSPVTSRSLGQDDIISSLHAHRIKNDLQQKYTASEVLALA